MKAIKGQQTAVTARHEAVSIHNQPADCHTSQKAPFAMTAMEMLFQYLRRVVFGFYLFDDIFDDAVFIDQESGSGSAHVLSTIH